MIGRLISHYKITARIGAGGMGEVYRATDTKLARDVAVKVLPEAFAADVHRMARFQREAQLLAALNHPNIAAVYGLEEGAPDEDRSAGAPVRALVMELVEGPTLAERIERGPILQEEALLLARQIAEALEYAHEHGIVHRDLKPANIKLTLEGQVKVLDFGLAKALEDNSATASNLNSPTLSLAATEAGVILGTAAYMSPEQVRSGAVDRRADVWAFGVVLFEMLAGKRLFDEPTASDALAAVLKSEMNLAALPAGIAPKVRWLIARCLERDRKRRLQAIGEARIAIDEVLAGLDQGVEAAASAPVSATQRVNVGWIVASFLAVALFVAALGWFRATRPLAKDVSRFAWVPAEGLAVAPNSSGVVAISRDGRTIAGILAEKGLSRIYVRRVDTLEASVLQGAEHASHPVFSPDGQWLAFFAGNRLKKARVLGGAIVDLAEAGENRGATWGDDGTLVYSPTATSPLIQVSDLGGPPRHITKLDETRRERTHRWPHFLPDAQAVLFTVGTIESPENYDGSRIEAVVLATGERRTVLEGASWAQFVEASGQLVFARGSTLFAVAFDPQRLQVSGSPVPVLQGVLGERSTGVLHASISAGGSLAYVPGGATGDDRVFAWVDRNNTVERLQAPARAYVEPSLSPDGRQVAVATSGGATSEIWIYDLSRATLGRLTFGPAAAAPLWSPDGKRVAYFEEFNSGKDAVSWKAADGSGNAEKILDVDEPTYPSSFSRDGKWLAVDVSTARHRSDIYVIPMTGDRKPQAFVATPADEFLPRFSPDGRWIAYQSNESGRDEIYVRAFPGPGGRWQISSEGGGEPTWSPDGKEIFYRRVNRLMGVTVDTRAGFQAGAPRVVVDAVVSSPGSRTGVTYAVAPDGKRFLTLRPAREENVASQVNVVLNWAEELRKSSAASKER